jgi:hypothetical protein
VFEMILMTQATIQPAVEWFDFVRRHQGFVGIPRLALRPQGVRNRIRMTVSVRGAYTAYCIELRLDVMGRQEDVMEDVISH